VAKWDIDPGGVSGVVNRTRARAEGFGTAATSTSDALGAAAGACGSLIVGGALHGFAGYVEPSMIAVEGRTDRILTAATEATQAYVDGDLEMAATAQANAAAAPDGTFAGGN
jgi:hypothetical protein